jgi:hypothetical protein
MVEEVVAAAVANLSQSLRTIVASNRSPLQLPASASSLLFCFFFFFPNGWRNFPQNQIKIIK